MCQSHQAAIASIPSLRPNFNPNSKLKQAQLSKFQVDSFVKIFPGVTHGWSVSYKDEDEAAVKSAEEAHRDISQLQLKEKHKLQYRNGLSMKQNTGTLTLNKLTVDKSLVEVFAKDLDKDSVILFGARASRVES